MFKNFALNLGYKYYIFIHSTLHFRLYHLISHFFIELVYVADSFIYSENRYTYATIDYIDA